MSLVVPPLALAAVIGLAVTGRDRPASPVVADAAPRNVVPAPSPTPGVAPNTEAAAVPVATPLRVLVNGEYRNRFTVGEPMTARVEPARRKPSRPSFRVGGPANDRVDPDTR